jgi:hypothetical protein
MEEVAMTADEKTRLVEVELAGSPPQVVAVKGHAKVS